jgi:hypothetical protein
MAVVQRALDNEIQKREEEFEIVEIFKAQGRK